MVYHPDLRRLEELGLNSSAPPGQLLYDGWLLRLLPGQAKRARSVNAVYPSALPLEDGWAGLFDIVTAPAVRRLGFGRRIVDNLLRGARELGADSAYLQVDAANTPARRLYAGYGFTERYRYRYRGHSD